MCHFTRRREDNHPGKTINKPHGSIFPDGFQVRVTIKKKGYYESDNDGMSTGGDEAFISHGKLILGNDRPF